MDAEQVFSIIKCPDCTSRKKVLGSGCRYYTEPGEIPCLSFSSYKTNILNVGHERWIIEITESNGITIVDIPTEVITIMEILEAHG